MFEIILVAISVAAGVVGTLTSVRDFRDKLVQFAKYLKKYPGREAYLIANSSELSSSTLLKEFHEFKSTLKPDIADRFKLVTEPGLVSPGSPGGVPEEVVKFIHANPTLGKPGQMFIRRKARRQHEVFKILLHNWMLGREPMTSNWIAETAGCSYRTVKAVLDKLGPAIERGTDRSVKLNRFPEDAWPEFAINAREDRATVLYTDRSGQPRSIESMYKRFLDLNRKDIAVGGAIGAQHHRPQLDLVGTPALDLTVHAPETRWVDFQVDRLDSALEPTTDTRDPIRLALHFLRRKESFFEKSIEGEVIADPVECLLDLYQARLTSQAEEFLGQFKYVGKDRYEQY